MPSASKPLVRAMEREANPVGAFVEDKCTVSEDRCIFSNRLYDLYLEWCKEQGIGFPSILSTLSRDLQAAFPKVSTERKYQGAKKVTVYHGIGEGNDADLIPD